MSDGRRCCRKFCAARGMAFNTLPTLRATAPKCLKPSARSALRAWFQRNWTLLIAQAGRKLDQGQKSERAGCNPGGGWDVLNRHPDGMKYRGIERTTPSAASMQSINGDAPWRFMITRRAVRNLGSLATSKAAPFD